MSKERLLAIFSKLRREPNPDRQVLDNYLSSLRVGEGKLAGIKPGKAFLGPEIYSNSKARLRIFFPPSAEETVLTEKSIHIEVVGGQIKTTCEGPYLYPRRARP